MNIIDGLNNVQTARQGTYNSFLPPWAQTNWPALGDMDGLQSKLRDARNQVADLQPQVAQLKSELAMSEVCDIIRTCGVTSRVVYQFTAQSLQRELSLFKAENERHIVGYQAKSEEFASYRRSKVGPIPTSLLEASSLTCTSSSKPNLLVSKVNLMLLTRPLHPFNPTFQTFKNFINPSPTSLLSLCRGITSCKRA